MALDRIAGVHEAESPMDMTSRFPGAGWTREFIAGAGGRPLDPSTTATQLIAKVSAKAGPAWAAGLGAVVSLKVDLVAVAAGEWDDRLTTLGHAVAGQQIVLVIWHEPENDMTAETFVAGFTAARTALKSAAPDLTVAYSAMAYQWRPLSTSTADPTAWAAVDADLYLVDVYSGKSFPAETILPEHPGFVSWYTEMIAAHPGRRWGVSERGILAGPTRVDTINREAAWLADTAAGRSCALYVWWNTPGTEGDARWLLDAAGEQAITALIARVNEHAKPAAATGYRPSGLPGFLVSERSGALVAEDMIAVHDQLLWSLHAG